MNDKTSRVKGSEYMHWAKTNLHAARYNLASSGLMNYPLSELPVSIADLEITGASFYGYEPLQNLLAAKSNVPVESVVAAIGTSMANHLVMAEILEAGDEVLIEQPTYELLVSAALYFGARVKRFPRRAEENYRIDPQEIAQRITSKTRLIVLTNLHNPTSALTDTETLLKIGEIAREAKAKVLVDEVYLDALFENAPPSAFHLGGAFVATNSLTKIYGLSGLRCGWILAEPQLAEKLWRLNDLFGSIPAHSAERLSCVALANLPRIAKRAWRILETNGRLLNSFFNSRFGENLDWRKHEFGTVSFPRLKRGASVEALAALLVEKYDTSIVPGKFFELPEHFRIGLGGCETATFAEGLERLGKALTEIR